MSAAANERMACHGRTAFLSHAVNADTGKVLCGKVKVTSLCHDDGLAAGELPDCWRCRQVIAKAAGIDSTTYRAWYDWIHVQHCACAGVTDAGATCLNRVPDCSDVKLFVPGFSDMCLEHRKAGAINRD